MSQGFSITIHYKPDGTKKNGDCCNVNHCQFQQLVLGYYILNGNSVPFNSSGGNHLPVNPFSYVDDGYTNASNYNMSDPFNFVTYDKPGAHQIDKNDSIDYYLSFIARVIDTTTGQVVAKKVGYWVKFEGKYKRNLTYGGFD